MLHVTRTSFQSLSSQDPNRLLSRMKVGPLMYRTYTQSRDHRACSCHSLSDKSHLCIPIPQWKQIVSSLPPVMTKFLSISEMKFENKKTVIQML